MEIDLGFFGNRLRRLYRKLRGIPDIDWVTKNLGVGGNTNCNVLYADAVFDVRAFPEGKSVSPKDIDNVVEEMAKQIFGGNRIFVHCRVGRGRGPMIAIAYLFKYSKESFSGAVYKVQKKRPYTHLSKDQIESLVKYRDFLFDRTEVMDKEIVVNYCV
jgi:hypothetical protein